MKTREKQSIVFYLFPEQGKGSTDFYLFLTSIEEGGIKKKQRNKREGQETLDAFSSSLGSDRRDDDGRL